MAEKPSLIYRLRAAANMYKQSWTGEQIPDGKPVWPTNDIFMFNLLNEAADRIESIEHQKVIL